MHIPSLAVLLALVGFALSQPAFAADGQTEMSAFFSSSYDYCDAKLLAAYWGHDVGEAKARIGRKIGWGDQAILEGMIASAKERARTNQSPTCNIYEAGYTYEDAALIAKLWGMTVEAAKATIESKVLWGNEAYLQSELARGRNGQATPAMSDDDAHFQRYANSGYCYCDARVLGSFWSSDAWDAKLTIGRKLGLGNPSFIEAALVQARGQARQRGESCEFYETGYSSADAEALAAAWGMPVSEAKARVGKLVMAGTKGQVDVAIRKGKSVRKGG